MSTTPRRELRERRQAFAFLSALDDPLAAVVREAGPIDAYALHLPVEANGAVEWLSFAIVSQQISQYAAAAIFNRLQAALGGTVTAAAMIAADDATLRTAGLSARKVISLRDLAHRLRDGRLEIDRLADLDDAEVLAQLLAVSGIGPWSAQVFMLGLLHRPDLFPAADVGLRAAIAVLDGLPKSATPKEGERRSQVWRPFRSYAAVYLWGLDAANRRRPGYAG